MSFRSNENHPGRRSTTFEQIRPMYRIKQRPIPVCPDEVHRRDGTILVLLPSFDGTYDPSKTRKWLQTIIDSRKYSIVLYGDKHFGHGDDDALKRLGVLFAKAVEEVKPDVVICSSRGGQVLKATMDADPEFNIPCVVINAFKDGYEPEPTKLKAPLVLVTCGNDSFNSRDPQHTMDTKFKGTFEVPILLFHDQESKHTWEDGKDVIDLLIKCALTRLTTIPDLDELKTKGGVWRKNDEKAFFEDLGGIKPLNTRTVPSFLSSIRKK